MKQLSIDEIVALSVGERTKYLDQLRASLPSWDDVQAKSQQIREALSAESVEDMSALISEMNRIWETHYAVKDDQTI